MQPSLSSASQRPSPVLGAGIQSLVITGPFSQGLLAFSSCCQKGEVSCSPHKSSGFLCLPTMVAPDQLCRLMHKPRGHRCSVLQ